MTGDWTPTGAIENRTMFEFALPKNLKKRKCETAILNLDSLESAITDVRNNMLTDCMTNTCKRLSSMLITTL